jgi:hypothetical protein
LESCLRNTTEPTQNLKNVEAYRRGLHAFIKYFTEYQMQELINDEIKREVFEQKSFF